MGGYVIWRAENLKQIRFLLGHASVQATERYLGCKQRLSQAANDNLELELEEPDLVSSQKRFLRTPKAEYRSARQPAPESSRFDSTLGEEVSERLTLSPGPDCFRIEPSLPSRATRRFH